MELIKKKICIESGIGRLPGFLPYFDDGTPIKCGNYGKYIYNIDFSKLIDNSEFSSLATIGDISYISAISRYYWIKDYFKNCVYYKPIVKNNNTTWTLVKNFNAEEEFCANLINNRLKEIIFNIGYSVYDIDYCKNKNDLAYININKNTIVGIPDDENSYDKFIDYGGMTYYKFIDRAIGKVLVPQEITGSLVPNYIFLNDVKDIIYDMTNLKENPNCCNIHKYNEMGGDDYVNFLKRFDETYIENEKAFFNNLKGKTPVINIPLSINSNFDNLGLMTVHENYFIPGVFYLKGERVLFNNETYECRKNITKDNVLESSNINNQEYWYKVSKEGTFTTSEIHYTGLSVLSSFRAYKRSFDDNGTELPGIVQDGSNALLFPFIEGTVKNITASTTDDRIDYYGDVLYSVTRNPNNMKYTFKYVIGGLLNEDKTYNIRSKTGILYEETYSFKVSSIETVYEGVLRNFIYDDIDFNQNLVNIEGTKIKATLANMTHFSNSILGKSIYNGENQTYLPTFREESNKFLTDSKIWNLTNIEVDRGSNPAFEKHFKLFEVNTLSDIEKYQNNFFNI